MIHSSMHSNWKKSKLELRLEKKGWILTSQRPEEPSTDFEKNQFRYLRANNIEFRVIKTVYDRDGITQLPGFIAIYVKEDEIPEYKPILFSLITGERVD